VKWSVAGWEDRFSARRALYREFRALGRPRSSSAQLSSRALDGRYVVRELVMNSRLVHHAARYLPAPVRHVLGDCWRSLRRMRFRRRLSSLDLSARPGEPRLNYAWVLPREAGAVVHGGRVKLLHLAQRFPEQDERFNLLYMVSSAMPYYAADLAAAARAGGAKFIWNQNGVAYPAWAGRAAERINKPLRECYQSADHVVFQSDFCRRSAERWLGPCRTTWQIVHNCVDTTAFSPPPSSISGPCRLLLAGTHQMPYRVLSALECLAALRRSGFEARLTVAGRLDWPGADGEVERAVASLGIAEACVFSPSFRQEDAPALYQGHHILLHTQYNDSCPTVPIEAMACGLPVVGSASGGMPELVGEDGGILLPAPEDWERVHPLDPRGMAEAVRTLWTDLPARSAAARQRAVARFDVRGWVAEHERLFGRILAGEAAS